MNKILTAILTILCLCNCLNGLAESLDDIRRKAEAGDVRAQLILGYLYDSGEGVPRKHREAVKWWHKAAEQGVASAQKRDSLAKVMSRDQVTKARAMGRNLRNTIDAKKKAKK